MKTQLALIVVVVLLASLPSIVFAQPPLSAVQSSETSQTAKATDIVQKSWKGPLFGLGLGLGHHTDRRESEGEIDSLSFTSLPFQIRLGYGLSDDWVFYSSVYGYGYSIDGAVDFWRHGLLGVMARDRNNFFGEYCMSFAIGAFLGGNFDSRPFVVRGSYGVEVRPGLLLEFAATTEFANDETGSFNSYIADITFNYHWY